MIIDGMILAAGRSSRAGCLKPAFLPGGRPLLHHCLDSLLPVCRRVLVVTGHRSREVHARKNCPSVQIQS